MKRICFILFFAVILSGCHRNKGIISGTVATSGQDTLLLCLAGNPAVADTLALPPSGEFKIKKEMAMPAFYDLSVRGQSVTIVLKPGDRVRVAGDAQNFIGTFQVDGSAESAQILALNERMRRTLQVKDSIDGLFRRAQQLSRTESYRGMLLERYAAELQDLRKSSIAFVESNRSSLAALYALYQKVTPQTYVFSEEEDLKYFQMVDTVLFKKYPGMPLVTMLHRNVQEMSDQLRRRRLGQMISGLGETAPAFSAQDASGKQVTLSSMRGKTVLVFFWASWHEASRAWNPVLHDIYRKYGGDRFEICQISFDYTYASWRKAAEEDDIVWTSLWEPQGRASALASDYQAESLPAMWLIDAEGTVIARQLTPEALQKKLEEVLKTE